MEKKYTIGIDYGTESARVVLVDLINGNVISNEIMNYKHGVIVDELPSGELLEADWALQDPNDYLKVLSITVPSVIKKSNVKAENIIGIGIDFTASTILPLDGLGNPLCFHNKWKNNPHSWVKLWKHHAAHKEADYMTQIALERKESFLQYYGGKISSEWMFPKILQVLREAPEVFEETDLFMEACDWITYRLTNQLVRSSNTSGYKALWNKKDGYPSTAYFKQVHHQLENIIETKMRGTVKTIGSRAGQLVTEMAELMGLIPGIDVSVGIIDAHAGVAAVGAIYPGQFVMTIGTSTCHMYISKEQSVVDGICGMVADGIIPGYISYETGQVAVGDSFAWFLEHGVPSYLKEEANEKNIQLHELLENKASQLFPGQSGLLALDWWNGNRSILVDAHLTGAIIGFTLNTRPEEVYRAMLEATAFGTRKIIESLEKKQLKVNEIFACGGIPQKNRLLLQVYADVTNRTIKVASSKETIALGASMYAAVAAGEKKGGFNSIENAAKLMAKVHEDTIKPIPENVEKYNQLYQYYLQLHDYFGKNHSTLMHGLKNLKSKSYEQL